MTLADNEKEFILRVYAKNGQNKKTTSFELDISLKTLYNKLHQYGDVKPLATEQEQMIEAQRGMI